MPLESWTKLQNEPYVSPLRNPPSSTGGQLRRLGEDYNTASRLLRRRARRGDVNSALGAIKLREQALEQGIPTGGIQRSEERRAGILGREQAMEEGTLDRERAIEANRLRAAEEITADGSPAPAASGISPRDTAALDILGGVQAEDDAMAQRGLDAASGMGVQQPYRILQGDQNRKFRKTLDSALGKASSPADVAALRERGTRYGIPQANFDRRANWWDRNRKTS